VEKVILQFLVCKIMVHILPTRPQLRSTNLICILAVDGPHVRRSACYTCPHITPFNVGCIMRR